MDIVKFAEATAGPLAVIIVAVVALLITRMIITKSGKIGMSFRDFRFEADASDRLVASPPAAPLTERAEPPEAATAGGQVLEQSDGSPQAIPAPPVQHEMEEFDRPFSRFLSAKSLIDLDAAFEDLKEEESVAADLDFWTTCYVGQKQRIGLSGTFEELEGLANSNPSWIHPVLDLLRAAVEAHDAARASKLIEQALARRTPENSSNLLQTILFAHFTLHSPERALRFYQQECAKGLTSSERAALLAALAANLDKDADKFAYRTASEMASVADPGRRAEGFQLAYSYADDPRFWALSYNAYSEVSPKSDRYTWTLNNRGVTLQGIDKTAAIDYYERGVERKNAQSISNLARLLIDDGYIGVGERLLDGIAEPGDAAEHIATTRAAALAARRHLQKRTDEILSFANAEAQRYRAVIGRALRAIDAGVSDQKGLFASEDGAFLVLLDGAGAAVRNVVGTLALEGVLLRSIVGFNGTIHAKGQGLLGTIVSVSILVTGANELTAVIWSYSKSLTDRIRFVELTRKVEQAMPQAVVPASALLTKS